MTEILLTRHGHVAGIEPERIRGRAPLELTEHGRAQAVDSGSVCIIRLNKTRHLDKLAALSAVRRQAKSA